MRYENVKAINNNKHVFTIKINRRLLNKRIKIINRITTQIIFILTFGFILGSFLNFIY